MRTKTDAPVNVFQCYETTSLKGVGKGGNLSNFGNRWSLQDERQGDYT